MGRAKERWLKPGQAAAELGLSVKALRVYERYGLVTPARTGSDWRIYGPAEIARLHLVIVLRDLGLSLKAIKAIIDEGPPSLPELLTRQQEQLETRRREITRAIALLRSARRRLASGEALAPDDLTQLTRETVMTHLDRYTAVEARIEDHVGKHLAQKDMQAIKDEMRAKLTEVGMSERDLIGELDILLTEARRLMAEGHADSEAARNLARRWLSVTRGWPQPSAEPATAVRQGMSDAMADPSLKPELPFDPEVLSFIKRATKALKAEGELS